MMVIELAGALALLTLSIGYMIGRMAKPRVIYLSAHDKHPNKVLMDTNKPISVIVGPEETVPLEVLISPGGTIHKMYKRERIS